MIASKTKAYKHFGSNYHVLQSLPIYRGGVTIELDQSHYRTNHDHYLALPWRVSRDWNELSKSGLRFAVAALVSELKAFEVCHYVFKYLNVIMQCHLTFNYAETTHKQDTCLNLVSHLL